MTAYMDDIMIYLGNELEHLHHVRTETEKPRAAGLYIDKRKCEFNIKEIKFLEFVIIPKGVNVDLERIVAIRE